jgi:ATP-dependent Lon protease
MPEIKRVGVFLELPVMPLREVVMFPRSIMPLFVGRESSIKAIETAQNSFDKQIFLVAQREPELEKPIDNDLCPVGVVSRILQVLRLPDGTIKVLFEGLYRARWQDMRESVCVLARVLRMRESQSRLEEKEALVRAVHEAMEEYGKATKRIPTEFASP